MNEENQDIVFTSFSELSKYNKTLLTHFVEYLNQKQKETHKVFTFRLGTSITAQPSEEIIQEFSDSVIENIKRKSKEI